MSKISLFFRADVAVYTSFCLLQLPTISSSNFLYAVEENPELLFRPPRLFYFLSALLNSFSLWGRVDDLSFLHCLSSLCFLLFEFHCTFSIYYKILPYYVYYYCILIRM